jgi:hypothetical protein
LRRASDPFTLPRFQHRENERGWASAAELEHRTTALAEDFPTFDGVLLLDDAFRAAAADDFGHWTTWAKADSYLSVHRQLFRAPFFRVPDSDHFFVFALLRNALPPTPERVAQLVADNRTL